jgi:hypothetical protein
MMKKTLAVLFILTLGGALFAESILNQPGASYDAALSYEKGFVKVLYHTLQFGQSTTNFDYIRQGGQEVLFPFERYTAEVGIFKRHNLVLLYQPLTIETQTRLEQTITIDDTTFDTADGYQSLDLKYGFPFWRISYLYSLLHGNRGYLDLGLSVQLRNASIVFRSSDGAKLTVNQNLGIVPILKFRGGYTFPGGFFLATEIDGFYASSSFFNGADFDFEGSIVDASVRAGFSVTDHLDLFANLRLIGGTATGTSQYDKDFWTDGVLKYSDNRLAALSFTLGATLK